MFRFISIRTIGFPLTCIIATPFVYALAVIPAKAGIQYLAMNLPLGPRLRGGDEIIGAGKSLDTRYWTSSLMPITPSRIENTMPPISTASERISAGSSTARKRLTATCTSRS